MQEGVRRGWQRGTGVSKASMDKQRGTGGGGSDLDAAKEVHNCREKWPLSHNNSDL